MVGQNQKEKMKTFEGSLQTASGQGAKVAVVD